MPLTINTRHLEEEALSIKVSCQPGIGAGPRGRPSARAAAVVF